MTAAARNLPIMPFVDSNSTTLNQGSGGSKEYNLLTSLRFFAAFGVVIHHFGEALRNGVVAGGRPLLSSLDAGVKVFFLLSGFILVLAYKDRHPDGIVPKKEFYWARFARIYPLFLFALILSIPQLLAAIHKGVDGASGGFWATYVVSKLTLTMSWIPRVAYDPPMLIPAWTLSCEMFFYLCFPFLFTWMRNAPPKVIVPILCLGLIWPFSNSLVLPPDEGGAWWFHAWFPPVRIGEFLAGMAFAFLVPSLQVLRGVTGTVLGFVAPVVTWIALSFLPLPAPFDGALDSAVILVWFYSWMNPTPMMEKVFGNKVMVLLGAASYSLYLLHGPLFRYIVRLPIGLSDERIRGTVLGFWLYAIFVVLASIAAYKGIEAPMQKWLRRLFSTRRPDRVAASKPSATTAANLSSTAP